MNTQQASVRRGDSRTTSQSTLNSSPTALRAPPRRTYVTAVQYTIRMQTPFRRSTACYSSETACKLIRIPMLRGRRHVSCKTVLFQHNLQVLNWKCQLKQLDLYSDCRTVVLGLCVVITLIRFLHYHPPAYCLAVSISNWIYFPCPTLRTPLCVSLLGEEAEASPSIGNTSRRVLTMFTRSAITPPEVNGFGRNLGNSKFIVWSRP